MPTLEVIDAAQAPKKLSYAARFARRRHDEFDGYLHALKRGQVGRLAPTGAESAKYPAPPHLVGDSPHRQRHIYFSVR